MVRLFREGVDRINVSLYDGPEQFKAFTEIRKRLKISIDQLKLRRRYYDNGNYGITFSNRTGLVSSQKYRDSNDEFDGDLPLNSPCYYPFYQVGIDYNGDVLLCPHDWSKKYIAGNAFQEPLWDIWRNKKFTFARRTLSKSKRSFSPCKTCDVAGDLVRGYSNGVRKLF